MHNRLFFVNVLYTFVNIEHNYGNIRHIDTVIN